MNIAEYDVYDVKKKQIVRKKKLGPKEWASDRDRRRLTTRLPFDLLVFLDDYVGWGQRATLLRWLLRGLEADLSRADFEKYVKSGKAIEELEKELEKQLKERQKELAAQETAGQKKATPCKRTWIQNNTKYNNRCR